MERNAFISMVRGYVLCVAAIAGIIEIIGDILVSDLAIVVIVIPLPLLVRQFLLSERGLIMKPFGFDISIGFSQLSLLLWMVDASEEWLVRW